MIDFRYHLVSLVAVFLALAIGIVLGAGPLRESLGETLTSQVEQLRADRDSMRQQNIALQASNDSLSKMITASQSSLVKNTIANKHVLIVTDSSELDTQTEAALALLGDAGADAGPIITLRETAWAPTKEADRQSAIDEVAKRWPDLAPTGTSTSETLSLMLAEVVSAHSNLSTADRGEILGILSQHGIVSVSGNSIRGADAVLYVSGTSDEYVNSNDSAADASTRADALTKGHKVFANELVKRGTPLTVASASSTADSSDGFVHTVRSSALKDSVSSVDSAESSSSPLVMVLAVAQSLTGAHGAFGNAGDASAILPDADSIRTALVTGVPASTQAPASDGGAQ